MTTISTTADLLRLLREDPDFRDQVRSLLLTQELIEMPERFARFEVYVEGQFSAVRGEITEIRGDIAQNTSDIAQNTSDIAQIRSDITDMRGDITDMRSDITEIRGDITEMRGDITEMRGDIAKNTSDIGGLRGAEYERRVGRSFASYASMAFRLRSGRSLRRNRLLSGTGSEANSAFLDLITDALDAGLIAEDEWTDLQQADAVMSGQHEGDTVYFVGEFSVTVNNHDLDRAVSRAAILGRATGSNAWAMVIGDTIPDPQRAKAESEGVLWRQVAE